MNMNQIYNFINSCDQVLGDLQSAQTTEMMDASVPNRGIFGFCVTNYSYYKNQTAANRVNDLQQQALHINQALGQTGFYQRGVYPLPTDFNGAAIMQAENAEHSLFADWLTSGTYSSVASTNTLNQINQTIAKIQNVRSQAVHLANLVQMVGPGQPAPFNAA